MDSPPANESAWQSETRNLLEGLLSMLSAKQQSLAQKEKELCLERESFRRKREKLDAEHEKKLEEMASEIAEIRLAYDVKRNRLDEENRLMNDVYKFQHEKIKLDVGGTSFSTSVSTLCKFENSMLAVMFSGRHKLVTSDDGSYFIDRDGTYFRYILNFLRGRVTDINDLPNERRILKEIRSEADFYQLDNLVELIDEILAKHEVGENDYTQEDINKLLSTVVKTDKTTTDYGINLPSPGFFSNGISELANAAFLSKNRSAGNNCERDKPAFVAQSMTKSKLDFTGKRLSGLTFAHATFNHDVLFRDCNLSGTKFYGCEFGVGITVDFTHSDLRDCDFRNCKGKEAGPKMNFGPSTFEFGNGGLVSGASSEIFVRMIQEKKIIFRGTRIDGTKFDPNVYIAVKNSVI